MGGYVELLLRHSRGSVTSGGLPDFKIVNVSCGVLLSGVRPTDHASQDLALVILSGQTFTGLRGYID